MTRAPEEVLVVEVMPNVVPAAVAGIIVDYAGGCGELVGRVGEAADHDDRRPDPPGEPCEPAGRPDEELSMLEPAGAFGKRPVAGLVLGSVWDVVPDESVAVHRLLVDAYDPIPG